MIQETRITEELLLNNSYQKDYCSVKRRSLCFSRQESFAVEKHYNPPQSGLLPLYRKWTEFLIGKLFFTGWLEELNGHFERLQVPTLQ